MPFLNFLCTFIDITAVAILPLEAIFYKLTLECPTFFVFFCLFLHENDIQLHEDQCCQVRLIDEISEPFTFASGTKQVCVLSPTFCNIFITMLRQATKDISDEDIVNICYHHDGCLFNLRRLQAHTKTMEHLIHNLLFTDDAALIANTERALQRLKSCCAEAVWHFGLEVDQKKTDVLLLAQNTIPPTSTFVLLS